MNREPASRHRYRFRRRTYGWFFATPLFSALVLIGCGPGQVASSSGGACAKVSDEQNFDEAGLVFRATAMDGDMRGGTLLSPARFRVSEYLKGTGPDEVLVATAVLADAESSEGIRPAPGEVWEIYADVSDSDLSDGVVATSVCSGSRKLWASCSPS